MNLQKDSNRVKNVLIITELTKKVSKTLAKEVVEFLESLKDFAVFSESEE